MRLRNWKETVPYTIEDTLLDVQPHSLDDPFHWCPQRGTPVWVKVPESEDEDCKHRWRKGVIEDELFERQYTHMGIFRTFVVATTIKRKPVLFTITPGIQPTLKPDSPEVRELLRRAGVHL
ncbi:hypothetical protein FA13DRAFT_1053910 [Coprinellus micaceus]|uniref:Uncharacterized protein n=1 Tax=Coprinellus micaceus TaxID=71717 RepID=A0A4Y7SXB3_COPMI|nr:hypothetical protein FA13DRAFT_1053910 [Coprinellus micaceus]